MDICRHRTGTYHPVWAYPKAGYFVNWCSIGGAFGIDTKTERLIMKKAQDIGGRIMAVFLSSALAIVGGSAVIAPELEIWKSAVLAGFAAVATVVQKLAQASLDGNLTLDEINEAFGAKKK
jgi:hypothetical protein